ncbi:MAG: CheR family methyltransferase [Bacillota bacterium]
MLPITEAEFKQLADYIKNNFGIYLKPEKQALLTGRLSNILENNKFTSFSEYYDYVIKDQTGKAAVSLIDRIATNYTYFMREIEHFHYLQNAVLPYLENTIKDRDLRIWSAGCSTGEEAYTLSFILDEYFKDKNWWDKKILATDISVGALTTAKDGIYDQKQLAPLPPIWKLNYFKKLASHKYEVIDRIKKEVIFRKLNLITDKFEFKKPFHIIFCRNVMIYFDNKDKMELIRKFYDITAHGGYLFIGHSESIARNDSNYSYIMPAVYRKI